MQVVKQYTWELAFYSLGTTFVIDKKSIQVALVSGNLFYCSHYSFYFGYFLIHMLIVKCFSMNLVYL
jgi:hypothetical protein